jgi:hypothetical protein
MVLLPGSFCLVDDPARRADAIRQARLLEVMRSLAAAKNLINFEVST